MIDYDPYCIAETFPPLPGSLIRLDLAPDHVRRAGIAELAVSGFTILPADDSSAKHGASDEDVNRDSVQRVADVKTYGGPGRFAELSGDLRGHTEGVSGAMKTHHRQCARCGEDFVQTRPADAFHRWKLFCGETCRIEHRRQRKREAARARRRGDSHRV